MTERLRFHVDVPGDLASAVRWYHQISPAIANRFRQAAREAFDRIREHPLLHGKVFDDVRAVRLESFPYLVQYRVKNETIFILAVFHSASDPARWRKRAR